MTITTQHNQAPSERPRAPRLQVGLAGSALQVARAQRLRFEVFTQEYGARLPGTIPGLDMDAWDPWCEHLIVENMFNGQVVATTRLLRSEHARQAGGFYSESEFDLSALVKRSGRILEVGRTCVHPDYRTGAVLSLLWSGIAAFVLDEGYDTLIGCGSISIRDGGTLAWSVTDQLLASHGLEPAHRVFPRCPLPRPHEASRQPAAIPPLIRAYTRLGARIGGEPCLDAAFGCADLLIVLNVKTLAERYARHFMSRERNA